MLSFRHLIALLCSIVNLLTERLKYLKFAYSGYTLRSRGDSSRCYYFAKPEKYFEEKPKLISAKVHFLKYFL